VGSVLVDGPASPALSAVASGPASVEQGAKVTLSALSSLGQITGYEWTAPDGVDLQDANTATPSFTVPTLTPDTSTTNLVFTLKVTGPGGSETATVTVKVLPVSAPRAAITPIGTVEQGTQVTLDGSHSTGAATYEWKHLRVGDDPQIALGDTSQPTLRFTFPTNVPVDPATGDPRPQRFQLTVTNVRGETSVATVDLNSASADALTTTRVRFVPDKGRWVIDGTAKLLAGNEVTVHAGPTLDGKVIGNAPVTNVGGQAQLGLWTVDAVGSGVTLDDAVCTGQVGKAYCVSIESKRGGSLLAVVVDDEDRLPAPPAPPAPAAAAAAAGAPAGAPAGAAGAAAARAVPVVGAAARPAVARLAAPAAVTPATIARAGIPVAFTAPTGATVARVRVLTTAGTPLLQTFKKVKAAARVKVTLRSASLKRKMRSGKRYVIEVRAGKSRTTLGKATRKTIRVR
jgi:K319-like protein